MTHSSHAMLKLAICSFELGTFCLGNLKLTVLTVTHTRHVKLTVLTTTQTRNAETKVFKHCCDKATSSYISLWLK
jgi:hypothetical protein